MDRLPHLIPVYFSNYERLVYLAQSESVELQATARRHADYLGLDYQYHHCGDTPLSHVLNTAIEH